MAYEEYQIYLLVIMIAFAVLTSIFAILDLMHIGKKKYRAEIKGVIRSVFILLAIGFICFTVAELWWTIYSMVSGEMTFIGPSDIFYVAGTLLLIAGFVYLSVFMHSKYGTTNRGLLLLVLGIIFSLAIVYYLVTAFIIGGQTGESTMEMILDYYYPVSSAVMVVSSLLVYSFFLRFKGFGRTLLLLALSSAAAFVGDMTYTYYAWNEIYGIIGLVSDVAYVLEYLLSFAAFGLLYLVLIRKGSEE